MRGPLLAVDAYRRVFLINLHVGIRCGALTVYTIAYIPDSPLCIVTLLSSHSCASIVVCLMC